ncbi:MAG: hypothetical protein QOG59_2325 [Solirubrobacteraceae bacterium]|jgi:hypothetical protein|nr:hypothetical protein [Solirubrobacteraceae bacterium]
MRRLRYEESMHLLSIVAADTVVVAEWATGRSEEWA